MLLQDKQKGVLVEVVDTTALINPAEAQIQARVQAGQEEQDPEPIAKDNLMFPSGEDLPRCWMDADYSQATKPGVGQ